MLEIVKKEIDQKIRELDGKTSLSAIEATLVTMLNKSAKMSNSSDQYASLSSDIMNLVLSMREERTIADILLKISARIDQINS